MPVPSPLAPFVDPLERLGLPYCITGSVAASVYGEPRLTADIDVVLLLHARDIRFMLAATSIDRPFVAAQVKRLGLEPPSGKKPPAPAERAGPDPLTCTTFRRRPCTRILRSANSIS